MNTLRLNKVTDQVQDVLDELDGVLTTTWGSPTKCNACRDVPAVAAMILRWEDERTHPTFKQKVYYCQQHLDAHQSTYNTNCEVRVDYL